MVTERQTASNISANAEATGNMHDVGGLEKRTFSFFAVVVVCPLGDAAFLNVGRCHSNYC